MIHASVEFHNVVEMEEVEGIAGWLPQRMPLSVRNHLSPRGRWNSQMTPGTEIRCVTEAPRLLLFISSLEGDAELLVFRGEQQYAVHTIKPGGLHCINVEPPPHLTAARTDAFHGARFPPHVWRFMTASYFTVFHRLESFGWEVRPPRPDEKPSVRWLAYGSSITAGCAAARTDLSYVQVAARAIGVDVLNLAMGGACFCEPELAAHIASRGDWDFATFELGVNMRGTIEPDEFERRVTFLLDATAARNPGKPVILVTSFYNLEDCLTIDTIHAVHQRTYNDILRRLAQERTCAGVRLIEGHSILGELSGLTTDLIHPDGYGQALMGFNLARQLAPLMNQKLEVRNPKR